MIGLDALDDLVDKRLSSSPGYIDTIHYLFWEKGIDYHAFNKLPIPYIFRIMKTHTWVKEEEARQAKKK